MRQAITSYFRLFWGLLTSIRTYHQFLVLPISQVLGTMAVGLLCLSGLWLARVYIKTLPSLINYTDQAITEFVSYYPTDLVISWDGQQLTTQPSAPYQVYFPSFYPRSTDQFPQRVMYYHPEDHDLEAVKRNTPISSYFVVTPTTIFTHNEVGEWSSAPLTDSPGFDQPFTLTKTDLTTAQSSWQQQSVEFWQVVRVGLLFMAPLYVLITTAWTGLIFFLVSYAFIIKLYRWPLNGQQLLRLVVPATVVATLVHFAAQLLYQYNPLPILTITYWVILLWSIKTLPAIQVTSPKRR